METAEKDTLTFLSSETAVQNVEATKSVRKSENRKKFQRKHAEECFQFTVKITVGRENVDFLVDTGSVRTFIGKSMLRNQL